MMQLRWDFNESEADIVVSNGTIALDDGLEAAVLISIFSDARARDDDDMAGLPKEKRGWWADTFSDARAVTGSRLWLRRRRAVSTALLADVKQDIQDALQWLLDDAVASAVNVTTERFGANGVRLSVEIIKPNAASPRWFRVWEMRQYGV